MDALRPASAPHRLSHYLLIFTLLILFIMSLAASTIDTPLSQPGGTAIAADVRASSGHHLVITHVQEVPGERGESINLFRHPRISAPAQAFSSCQLMNAQVRISAPPTITSVSAAWIPARFAGEPSLTAEETVALSTSSRTFKRVFASSTFPINEVSCDLPADHSFGKELILPSIANRTPVFWIRVEGANDARAVVVLELHLVFSGIPPQ